MYIAKTNSEVKPFLAIKSSVEQFWLLNFGGGECDTHLPILLLSSSLIFWYTSCRAVMPCSWEGNRGHRRKWFIHLRDQGRWAAPPQHLMGYGVHSPCLVVNKKWRSSVVTGDRMNGYGVVKGVLFPNGIVYIERLSPPKKIVGVITKGNGAFLCSFVPIWAFMWRG